MSVTRISGGSVQGYTDNVWSQYRRCRVLRSRPPGKRCGLRHKFASSLYFPTCSARLAAPDPIKAHAIRHFNPFFYCCFLQFIILFVKYRLPLYSSFFNTYLLRKMKSGIERRKREMKSQLFLHLYIASRVGLITRNKLNLMLYFKLSHEFAHKINHQIIFEVYLRKTSWCGTNFT